MIAVLFAVALGAFLVSAVAGGGAGLVLVPVLRAVVPISGVPAALSIGTAASAISRAAAFRRRVRWDVVARFVPAALPAAALGAWLLSRFEPAYVELVVALFLLANLPALLRRAPPREDVRPLGLAALPWIGAAAGLLSGFTGAVGLLFNGAYRRLGLDREEIVATRATNEVLIHLLKLALYAKFGLITAPVLAAGLVVAAAAVGASLAARRLLPRIDEGAFRRIGHGATVAAGGAMLLLSSAQIARLHDAWVRQVAPGGEHELQAIWAGRQVAAIEWEPEGYPAFEWTVPAAALPAHVAAAVPRDRIVLVETVVTPHGRSYEVHWRPPTGGLATAEFAEAS